MEFRKLGNIQVPAVGLGTYRTFDVSSDGEIEVRRKVVDNCVAERATFIDTAAMYGNAERVIGLVTEGRRDSFQIATKVRIHGKEEGERQIARSFALMKTDYVELLQIHNLVDWRTHLPTLERLKEEGKTGMIGVTCMTPGDYPEVAQIMKSGRIDTVQIPYNVFDRAVEDEVLPLAGELGIGILVMEPLKKGRYVSGLKRQPDLKPLAALGVQTWAQALIAWVLSDPRVSIAIPATTRPERVKENAAAGSIRLPQELRDYVREETERCL
ncbi:MAG: aldo/keto reductase [Chloroflexi bacterium]|nr:aldo/keto reductase [Chloroflexota bacterium]